MSATPGPSLWPPSFSAAIFDFDGTLAETWPLWRRVDEIFFATRGLPFDEDASVTLATLGFAAGAQWCVERYRLRDEVADIVDEWNRLGAAESVPARMSSKTTQSAGSAPSRRAASR